MAKGRSGGGITSKNVTRQGVRTGMPGREINPRGVSQIGSSIGNHSTEKAKILRGGVEPVRGALRPPGTPGAVPLGNQAALNVGKGGVGSGRTLYGQCGTQGQHGPVAGSPKPIGRGFDD